MAAGMTAKHRKGGVTYTISGGLAVAIEKSKKELEKKQDSQERMFLKWQYEKSKRAYETYEKRIKDLEEFIPFAEEKLKEKEEKAHE
jgi:hypothetical protein